ncbi:MAG: TonB-dependent receptor [Sphingomonas sp.]
MGPVLFAIMSGIAGAPAALPPRDDSTIVVTGERVKRSLRETQSSVVVFGRRDIEALAAADRVQDLLQFVPNVLISSNRDTPIIRGQNSAGVLAGLPAFLGGARPRTTLQVDGRTVTFNEFSNSTEGLWDVDHVEVFRSPQTTTQGVNSIAGAIFIHTADPTYRFEGGARGIAGGPARRQLSAAASVPLIDQQLALRLSGDLYRGHVSSRLEGPVVGADLNDDRYATARAKLLVEPHALPGLRIVLTYAHVRSQGPQGTSARRPFRERRDTSCICGYFKVRVDSLTSAINYQVTRSLESRTTLSWGKAFFRRFAVQGFGQTRIHGDDGSAESVLEWKPDAPVTMVGGVSWQTMDLHQYIDLSATPLGTGTFDDRQRSRGLFGEVTWRPVPRLLLTGGVRYQSDSRKRLGVLHTTPDLPLDYHKNVTALLPKASAAYDVNERVRVGVLAQRAYNPGGVTLDPSEAAQVRFEPEYLWDYEAFVRGNFLGGALNLTANVFYNDIRNAQRTLDLCLQTTTGCVGLSQVSNAPRAHASGAELEGDYKVSGRLRLRSAIGLLGTRITKTIVPTDPILGKEFGGAPKFTGMAAAEWEPVRKLSISAQVRHNSGYGGDDAETPRFRIASSTTFDARVSWRRGPFTLFGYARNIFDEFHIVAWGGDPNDPDVEAGLNDPRELGIGLETRF